MYYLHQTYQEQPWKFLLWAVKLPYLTSVMDCVTNHLHRWYACVPAVYWKETVTGMVQ